MLIKGIYVLIIKLDRNTNTAVGSLGTVNFEKGYYAYVGSALNSLEGRINRHCRKEKKLRWHIDYLLREGRISDILIFETTERKECETARRLKKKLWSVKNFGSSDCSCDSHLFYSIENPACLLEDFSRFPAPEQQV